MAVWAIRYQSGSGFYDRVVTGSRERDAQCRAISGSGDTILKLTRI